MARHSVTGLLLRAFLLDGWSPGIRQGSPDRVRADTKPVSDLYQRQAAFLGPHRLANMLWSETTARHLDARLSSGPKCVCG